MAKVFSHPALESYIPRIQEAVSWELHGWCRESGSISMFSSAKALTFRIAARILLGLSLGEKQFKELARVFEQLVENLFSLPLDIPFSGLRKVCTYYQIHIQIMLLAPYSFCYIQGHICWLVHNLCPGSTVCNYSTIHLHCAPSTESIPLDRRLRK